MEIARKTRRWQPRNEDDEDYYSRYFGIGTVMAVADAGEPEHAPTLFLRVGGDWVEHVLRAEPVARRVGFREPE